MTILNITLQISTTLTPDEAAEAIREATENTGSIEVIAAFPSVGAEALDSMFDFLAECPGDAYGLTEEQAQYLLTQVPRAEVFNEVDAQRTVTPGDQAYADHQALIALLEAHGGPLG